MSKGMPAGWTWATVNDLAKYVNGLAFKPADWEPSGRPIIRIQNLTGERAFNHTTKVVSKESVVCEGDILVSWSATLDVFVWRGPEAVLNQHIFKVIPSKHIRDHGFLRWALKSAIEELWASEHSHGTTMKHVNRRPFLAHSLKLPPAREQRRIAEVLESYYTRLDEAVATLERVKRNLKRYRASVLKAAVEGRLVPIEAELARAERRSFEPASVLLDRILADRRRRWEEAELAKLKARGKVAKDDRWKARYVEPAAPDTNDLPELPEGWCWVRIDTAGHVQLGRQRSPAHHAGPHMRPYLRVANVFEDRIDVSDLKSMNFTPEEFEVYRLNFGDILLNEGQSPHLVGRPAMYRDEVPGACFTNSLVRFQAFQGVDPRFALIVFLSQLQMRRYMRIAQITTNIAHLGAGRFSEIEFPLPPLVEQVRIADEVERLMTTTHAAIATIASDLARIVRLRQTLLKWAFEGRLVDQDPTDEPAHILLERIRAERAAANGGPPGASANGQSPQDRGRQLRVEKL